MPGWPGWQASLDEAAKRLWQKMVKADPEILALRLAAKGTKCTSWPTLYALTVDLAGPLPQRPGPEQLFSFAAFNALHDALWARCRPSR